MNIEQKLRLAHSITANAVNARMGFFRWGWIVERARQYPAMCPLHIVRNRIQYPFSY